MFIICNKYRILQRYPLQQNYHSLNMLVDHELPPDHIIYLFSSKSRLENMLAFNP
jgi:hypothetical protein